MTLRRRLTVVLALAVGLSAAALGAGSYFVVRHNLLADSVDSATVQTRRNLEVARAYRLPARLLQAYERRGFVAVVVRDGRVVSSFSVGLRQVPPGLREVVDNGELGYQRTTVAGTHYLVTGGPAEGTKVYFFFSEFSQPFDPLVGDRQLGRYREWKSVTASQSRRDAERELCPFCQLDRQTQPLVQG